MKKSKQLKVLVIIAGIILLSVIGVYIGLAVGDVIDTSIRFDIIFAIITPFLSVGLVALFSAYVSQIVAEKQLRNENIYNLGIDCHFYNFYFFQKDVNKVLYKKKFRELEPRIIAFTPTKNAATRNYSHSSFNSSFVGLIARSIVSNFGTYNQDHKTPIHYCYYHGVFLIFMFGDNKDVQELTDFLERDAYDIAKREKLNIYVQPFFGVTSIKRDKETLVVYIDQALEARNNAERTFQTLTYFDSASIQNTPISQVDEIKEGVLNDEFVVYYQPKFSLNTHRFISSEALIRWNSKKYGLLPPSKFIEVAENSGIIHMIDKFVLERVCYDIHDNTIKGKRNLPVSVNFSKQEFYDMDFIDEMFEICKKYNVSPSYIQIEVTESTSQVNSFMANSIINKLRENGFRVLMDDFGTGFSNIENLLNVQFDAVKLDKSYIDRIVTDPKSKELVKFLINLCRMNKMEVVAEGVDKLEQVKLLKSLGCDTIQGYYYSKPLAKLDFDHFIAKGGNEFEKGKLEG